MPEEHAPSEFQVAISRGRLSGRRIRPVGSATRRARGWRLDAHVTAAGHVLEFRFGLRSRLNLVFAPRSDPLLDEGDLVERFEVAETSDEILHQAEDATLTFLARRFGPRVEREFGALVESIEAGGRASEDALVARSDGILTVLQFSRRERGVTVETQRALPDELRVVSTYANVELGPPGR